MTNALLRQVSWVDATKLKLGLNGKVSEPSNNTQYVVNSMLPSSKFAMARVYDWIKTPEQQDQMSKRKVCS